MPRTQTARHNDRVISLVSDWEFDVVGHKTGDHFCVAILFFRLFQHLFTRVQRIDIFVANSGVAWTKGPFLDGPEDHYRQIMSTNVDGTAYCARAAGRHFRRQKAEGTTVDGAKLENYTYGSFIATASMSGHIVNIPQLQAAYNASKAAVIHLCRSLAVEWAGFARANSISPGYINTEISDFNSPEVRSVWADKIPMG